MTLSEAREKLQRYGQEHLLRYYEELSGQEKENLLAQIEDADMDILEACRHRETLTQRGVITPLGAMRLEEIEKNRESFTATGLEAVRAGKVGAVLLAGGMGTRLGSDDPKGVYNVGITRPLYIFECLINNMLDVVRQADAWFHLFVMTSDKNHEATVSFLKEHDFFGYREEYVHFFKQKMAAATDYQGKIYLEEKGRLATSPNGNGGWFVSLQKAGLLELVQKEGIEWLNVFAVDNVLQRVADPCFIGATIQKGCTVGAKVVRKNAPDEKVGAICLEDGRPSIVEYYDMTQELMDARDEAGEPAYYFGVILNYLFQVEELNRIVKQSLPLHLVEKKIPCLNEAGETVKPETPNGFKYENLVLDMIHQMKSCLPFEVVREKEFAPIKNRTGIDSVESARALLEQNGVTL
ncbi:MAG: UTP--glucose-1-phosphate uridylyltransferase [bacterium]|nr:UTP--glucose-1-phosphate uridylyltransferase [bacterium]